MYEIDNGIFCNNLKKYRKSRKITLKMLGEKINKTKATVSKYERGEIIPDFLTVLEICNALKISIFQLFPTSIEEQKKYLKNPFSSDIIYMYYYTDNILIKSVIELFEDNKSLKVKYYNGVKNISEYHNCASYIYDGVLECDKTVGYINVVNTESSDMQLEKLQISINLAWSKNFEMTNFFIMGLTPNSIPIVKKGILSAFPIENFDIFEDDLSITKEDIQDIQKHSGWILNNKNYNHFFLDN